MDISHWHLTASNVLKCHIDISQQHLTATSHLDISQQVTYWHVRFISHTHISHWHLFDISYWHLTASNVLTSHLDISQQITYWHLPFISHIHITLTFHIHISHSHHIDISHSHLTASNASANASAYKTRYAKKITGAFQTLFLFGESAHALAVRRPVGFGESLCARVGASLWRQLTGWVTGQGRTHRFGVHFGVPTTRGLVA